MREGAKIAWTWSDIGLTLQLALLTLPAWILPDRFWSAAWRAKAHFPGPTGPGVRRNTRTIATALGDVSQSEAQRIARDLRAAIKELKTQSLKGWRPGGWRPAIALEGEEHLKRAVEAGKGAILWIAPFVFYSGASKIALREKGYLVSHLSSTVHGFSGSQYGIQFLNRIQCVPEDRNIKERIVFDRDAPSTAMRRLLRALKAGEVVSIAAASTEGLEMVETPFLGGRTPVAVGAPRLAGLTGAPVLPMFVVREKNGVFRVVIEPPIALDPKQSSDERCVAAATEFFRRLEPYVRKHPEQWRGWSKWRQD